MVSLAIAVRFRVSNGQLLRLERVVLSEMAQTISDTETQEIISFFYIVARIVGGHPVRDGIDIQLHFFGSLRLTNEHLAGRYESRDQIQFRIIQVECVAVYVAVHLRVGKEDFGGTTLRNDRQQSRILKLFERLSSED